MEIITVDGRKSVLKLSEADEKLYKDFLRLKVEIPDHPLGPQYQTKCKAEVAFQEFLKNSWGLLGEMGLDSPKLKSLSGHISLEENLIKVQCAPFEMGKTSYDERSNSGHGFKYTPQLVFRAGRELVVEESYAETGRTRISLEIARNVVALMFPGQGDGMNKPQVEMVTMGGNYGPTERIYVSSVKHLPVVLGRLQETFAGIRDDRLGTLIYLHSEAEDQQKKNSYCANLLQKTYRDLLERVVL